MSMMRFRSALNPNLVIELQGGKFKAGTPLQLGEGKGNSSSGYDYQWFLGGSNFLKCYSPDDFVLNVQGNNLKPGAVVNISTRNNPTTPNQQWLTYYKFGHIASDNPHRNEGMLVIDIPNANTAPGTQVQLYKVNTPVTMNQLWQKQVTPGNQVYFVSALDPNQVLEVRGANKAAGTPVQIYPRNSPITANQLWKEEVTRLVSGLANAQNKLVLEAAGAGNQSLKSGMPLQVLPANGPNSTPSQRWIYYGSYCYIQLASNRNLVLDVKGSVAQPGTPIQLWTKNVPATANQLWTVEGEYF